MAETNIRPPGFRFLPTTGELIGYYLYNYVKHTYHPEDFLPICYRDLHNTEPWDLWQSSQNLGDNGGAGPETDVFIFGERKKTQESYTRYNRKVGSNGATWHGEDQGTKYKLGILGSDGGASEDPNWIGLRKRFKYTNPNLTDDDGTGWILHEFSISNDGGKTYFKDVVCMLRRLENSNAAAVVGEKRGIQDNIINVSEGNSNGRRGRKRVNFSTPLTTQMPPLTTQMSPLISPVEEVTGRILHCSSHYQLNFQQEGFSIQGSTSNSYQFQNNRYDPYHEKGNAHNIEPWPNLQDGRMMLQEQPLSYQELLTWEFDPTIAVHFDRSPMIDVMIQGQQASAMAMSTPGGITQQSAVAMCDPPTLYPVSMFEPMAQFAPPPPLPLNEICRREYQDPTSVMDYPRSARWYEDHQVSRMPFSGLVSESEEFYNGGMSLDFPAHGPASSTTASNGGTEQQQQQIVQSFVPKAEQQRPLPVISDFKEDDDDCWLQYFNFY
ncbi:Protein SOMBRERO [Linum perenne]